MKKLIAILVFAATACTLAQQPAKDEKPKLSEAQLLKKDLVIVQRQLLQCQSGQLDQLMMNLQGEFVKTLGGKPGDNFDWNANTVVPKSK